MKKIFSLALGALLVLGMASCSKEDVKPINNAERNANALKANQSNNFADTEWQSTVDTTYQFVIGGETFFDPFYGDTVTIPTDTMAFGLNAKFSLSFNSTGDTVNLGIQFNDEDVIFVTYFGMSTTIPFAFDYDITTNQGTMTAVFQDVTGSENVDMVFNFTYDVTNNTMIVNVPMQTEDGNPIVDSFLSIFQNLVFSLI